MKLSEFRKKLVQETDFRLKLQKFSFGRMATFVHQTIDYKAGEVYSMRSPDGSKISESMRILQSFLGEISLEDYRKLYSECGANLSRNYRNRDLI